MTNGCRLLAFCLLLALFPGGRAGGEEKKPEIDGLSYSLVKEIRGARVEINNAGELSFSLDGRELIRKDHVSLNQGDKFLYSSEWTAEPPEVEIREEDGFWKAVLTVRKEQVGVITKTVVFRDGLLCCSVQADRDETFPELECGYSVRLASAGSGEIRFSGQADGKPFSGTLPEQPAELRWDVVPAMSELEFPRPGGGNGLHIRFEPFAPGNRNRWRFHDLRRHPQENMRYLVLSSEEKLDRNVPSARNAILFRWGDRKTESALADLAKACSISSPEPAADAPAERQPEATPALGRHVTGRNLFPGDSSFESGVGFWLPQGGYALDATEAVDGTRSLRLQAPFLFSYVNGILGSAGILLENDSDYVVSLWMKGEEKNQNVTLRLMRGDWRCLTRECVLGPEWRRFDIRLGRENFDEARERWSISLYSGERKKIWLDAVQLEKGTVPTDYSSPAPVSFSLNSAFAANLFHPEDPAVFQTGFYNSTADPLPLVVKWTVWDAFTSRELHHGKAETVLPGKSTTPLSLPVGEKGSLPPGFYRLEVNVEANGTELETREAWFVVTPQVFPAKSRFAGMRCEGALPELTAMRRLGAGWVSLAAGVDWNLVEPVAGVYDQARLAFADDAVNAALRNGLAVRLGLGGTPRWASEAPDGNDNFSNYPPTDFSHLTAYARFLANRYRGLVVQWEILGEADLSWRGTQNWDDETAAGKIAGYIRAASSGIRQGDPLAKISACGMSSSHAMNFLEMVFARCSDVIDDVDLHPYPGIRNIGPAGKWVEPENNFLVESLAELREVLDRKNPAVGHGVGELGYTLDVTVPPDGKFAFDHAAILQRSFLLAFAAGATKINWYCTFNNDEPYGYRYGVFRDGEGYQPLPAAAAFAVAAAMTDEMKVVSHQWIANAMIAITLEGEERTVLAIWNGRNDKQIKMNVTAEIPLEIVNMLGTPVGRAKAGEPLACELGRYPLFFLAGPGCAEKLTQAVMRADYQVPPLDVAVSLENRTTLKLEFRNRVTYPVAGTVELLLSEPFSPEKKEWKLPTVPVNGSSTLEIPFQCAGDSVPERLEANVNVKTSRGRKVQAEAGFDLFPVFRMPDRKRFDRPLQEWPGRSVMLTREHIRPPDIMNSGIWKGEKDFSLQFRCAYDADYFYLGIDVEDDIHFPAENIARGYNGDSIQFAADNRKLSPPGDSYSSHNSEFGFALIDGVPQGTAYIAAGETDSSLPLLSRIERQEGKTVYRLGIPWGRMGISGVRPGDVFRAGFVAFDQDGPNESTRWLEFSGGIAGGKHPEQFKTFLLE